MEAIALLAELAIYGMSADVCDGELFIVGDYEIVPASLREDVRNHCDEIEQLITGRVSC